MRYQIGIIRKAQRQLMKLPVSAQERIAESIGMLSHNPDNPALDVKPLKNDFEARYRLRVGDYQVKFNRDDEIFIIEITRVAHRKDVYK